MRLADPGVLEAIADVLQIEWQTTAYSVHGNPVYTAHLHNTELNLPVRLVIWPSLGRLDTYFGKSYTNFKNIDDVLILPGVEAIFKRGTRDYLLVTRAGRVASSSG